LYSVGVTRSLMIQIVHVLPLKTPFGLLTPDVQCWGFLICSDHQSYSYSLRTPFGLVIPLLQSSVTRNYNHSQLFRTLLCVYTSIILTRSSLQSLSPFLHTKSPYWLNASSLADFTAISHYHRLSHTVAHAEFSIHAANSLLVELLLITDLEDCSLNTQVALLFQDWPRYISNWAYVAFSPIPRKPVTVALTIAEQRTIDISPTVASVSQWRDCLLCCLGDACDVTVACSSPPAERGDTERTPLPLPRSEAFSGQLTRNALLRNPTMGWLVTILISFCLFIFLFVCFHVYGGEEPAFLQSSQ
jgi:hypothetical protein